MKIRISKRLLEHSGVFEIFWISKKVSKLILAQASDSKNSVLVPVISATLPERSTSNLYYAYIQNDVST
jgi:hypothetical protein